MLYRTAPKHAAPVRGTIEEPVDIAHRALVEFAYSVEMTVSK